MMSIRHRRGGSSSRYGPRGPLLFEDNLRRMLRRSDRFWSSNGSRSRPLVADPHSRSLSSWALRAFS